MLSEDCTEALSIQANVTISGSSAKLINNDIAPLPFPPRAAKAILVHQARGEGQGEGTCSILCNVRVYCSCSILGFLGSQTQSVFTVLSSWRRNLLVRTLTIIK